MDSLDMCSLDDMYARGFTVHELEERQMAAHLLLLRQVVAHCLAAHLLSRHLRCMWLHGAYALWTQVIMWKLSSALGA